MKKFFCLLAIAALFLFVIVSCKEKETISDIKIDKTSLTLGVGESETLLANLLPYGATDKMSWKSSDDNVVSLKGDNSSGSVTKCVVTTKANGRAIITVSTKDGKHKATCTITVIGTDPEMVRVEGGTFTMGCNDNDCIENEKPQHEVTVSGFNIAKYLVTQKQWTAIMGSNPSYNIGDYLPVERVSWTDVQVYIQKLNTATGKKYRLPTEAEWEYAARGGNKSGKFIYSGSNDVDEVAWYRGNANWTSHPVGGKKENELGIFDMSGNVWEFCSDWYGDYSDEAQNNPTGPETGMYRVVRGGGYYNEAVYIRNACRSSFYTDASSDGVGFRLAHD